MLFLNYPPPYIREVWHYKEANADLVKRVINNFNWGKFFSNTNINEKVSLSNKTLLNILNNYIPHETMICDDKDPPRFNSWIKSLIENKNKLRKNYRQFKSNSQLLSKLNLRTAATPKVELFMKIVNGFQPLTIITKSFTLDVAAVLDPRLWSYYARMASKLSNVQRNSKSYWSLLAYLL